MSELRLFTALVEVVPLPGAELDPAEHAGAFVRLYVTAPNMLAAIDRMRMSLEKSHFTLVDFSWCANHADMEWDDPDDLTGEAFLSEATSTREVVFGEFHSWPNDE